MRGAPGRQRRASALPGVPLPVRRCAIPAPSSSLSCCAATCATSPSPPGACRDQPAPCRTGVEFDFTLALRDDATGRPFLLPVHRAPDARSQEQGRTPEPAGPARPHHPRAARWDPAGPGATWRKFAKTNERSQFILVNNTKPLPKGLIHELLPDTVGHLPAQYARRQLPATIMMRLNNDRETLLDTDSPFNGRIATPTTPAGHIKDNSVLEMIENSLYEGALYQYREPRDGSADEEQMLLHLKIFWSLVRATWRTAWKLPPRKSRLSHGVGVQALGFVMDHLTEGVPAPELLAPDRGRSLARLKPFCAWTDGTWDFGPEEQRR